MPGGISRGSTAAAGASAGSTGSRSTRRSPARPGGAPDPLDKRLVGGLPSPEDDTAAGQTAGLLERALAQLTPEYREVVVLRHWLDLSYDEIAEVVHVPAKTVKSLRFSARQRLGQVLQQFGYRPE
jgi:RNA polymerase sigma-70 factor (ECF subfamily)